MIAQGCYHISPSVYTTVVRAFGLGVLVTGLNKRCALQYNSEFRLFFSRLGFRALRFRALRHEGVPQKYHSVVVRADSVSSNSYKRNVVADSVNMAFHVGSFIYGRRRGCKARGM